MTACSWWNVGLGAVNGMGVLVNVAFYRRSRRAIRRVMERYLPGASVLKHLDSDKKE